jgi:hypothetical protein
MITHRKKKSVLADTAERTQRENFVTKNVRKHTNQITKMKNKPMDELKDFMREQSEIQAILETPCISREFIFEVKESEISKRVKKQYEGFTLTQFLNHTGKK